MKITDVAAENDGIMFNNWCRSTTTQPENTAKGKTTTEKLPPGITSECNIVTVGSDCSSIYIV